MQCQVVRRVVPVNCRDLLAVLSTSAVVTPCVVPAARPRVRRCGIWPELLDPLLSYLSFGPGARLPNPCAALIGVSVSAKTFSWCVRQTNIVQYVLIGHALRSVICIFFVVAPCG
jgi:hypothetical protein